MTCLRVLFLLSADAPILLPFSAFGRRAAALCRIGIRALIRFTTPSARSSALGGSGYWLCRTLALKSCESLQLCLFYVRHAHTQRVHTGTVKQDVPGASA